MSEEFRCKFYKMATSQCSRLLSRRLINHSRISIRHHNFDGEIPQKTHMSLITREDESHTYILKYSNRGFFLSSGINVLGPCAVFPRAVLHWAVPSADMITPESLSLFCMLQPKLDFLIIGKGDWEAKVDINIYKFLRRKNINVEILPTEQACSTFNFLNSERRVVAAGLIPPVHIPNEFADEALPDLDLQDKDSILDPMSDIDKKIESVKDKNIFQIVAEHNLQKNRIQKQSQLDDESRANRGEQETSKEQKP